MFMVDKALEGGVVAGELLQEAMTRLKRARTPITNQRYFFINILLKSLRLICLYHNRDNTVCKVRWFQVRWFQAGIAIDNINFNKYTSGIQGNPSNKEIMIV
jgi:hypothetical protein